MAAKQTDVLQPYKPQNFPNLPGSQQRYLPQEDQRVSVAINQVIQVMKQLEDRMIAAGI